MRRTVSVCPISTLGGSSGGVFLCGPKAEDPRYSPTANLGSLLMRSGIPYDSESDHGLSVATPPSGFRNPMGLTRSIT